MAFTLPPITMAGVTNAVAAGHTTPGEATEIAKVIDAYVRVIRPQNWMDSGAHGAVERCRVDAYCHGRWANRRDFRTAISETSDPQSVLRLLTFAIITQNELGCLDGLCSVAC
jgi:hypothetical protein